MITPPRFTETVLMSLGATPEYRDAVVGDLAEEMAWRAAYDGPVAARWWYYREAVRSIPHLLGNGARAMRWRSVRRVAGIAATAWILSTMLVGVTFMILFSSAHRIWVQFPLTLRVGSVPLVVGTILAIGGSVIGGYIAAWLDRETPLVSAAAFGVALGIAQTLATLALSGELSSGWLVAVVPLIRTACALGGALLQVRTRLRAAESTPGAA